MHKSMVKLSPKLRCQRCSVYNKGVLCYHLCKGHFHLTRQRTQIIPLFFYLFSLSELTWIGFTDQKQETDFRWLNGAPLYYRKFNSANPEGRRNQNCVGMIAEFRDLSCSRQDKILCSSIGMPVKCLTFFCFESQFKVKF